MVPAGAPRAAREVASRDCYVWSDDPTRYRDARVIFQRLRALQLGMGSRRRAVLLAPVLLAPTRPQLRQPRGPARDAAHCRVLVRAWVSTVCDSTPCPYLFEREGTTSENLNETHDFLRELRSHVDAHFADRVLLAEANQWPEDAAAYFGDGDECHMAFHFPLMPRLFMGLRMEDRFPIIDILRQTPQSPDGCQWARFLRNHDELTLEMVTDEERDYMYRAYADDPLMRVNFGIRRRLAPLLQNDRHKIEL